MAVLFGRRIIVDVAGLTITEPRIHVDLERQIDKTQDRGEIAIYNLSDEHEKQIYERGAALTVQAGYPETTAIIYQGQLARVERVRERNARITKIKIGDEVRQRNRLGGYYAESLAGTTPVRQIVERIVKAMNAARPAVFATPLFPIRLGPLDAIPAGATFEDWQWDSGGAELALTTILDYVDCTWFEYDGVIRINRTRVLQSDAPMVAISPETGLIDRPAVTDEGAECKMFLNPAVRLGGLLDITSEALIGQFKIVSIRHTADNWQGPFRTFCDLRPLDDAGV